MDLQVRPDRLLKMETENTLGTGEESKEKGRLVMMESIRLPEPPTSMTVAKSRCVHLVVEGKTIECDLDRLLEKSSMIRDMYDICKSPDVKDPASKPEIEQLPITGPVTYDTMVWVVKYIQCLADVHITKEENYKQLMEAADFMGIESLSNQCRRFIVDRLKLNNCVDRWTFLFTKLGLDQLRKHTEDYMAAVFFELMESEFRMDMTENLLVNLLQRSDLRVKSEYWVFTYVADWAQQPEREIMEGQVFKLVQYHLLNENQLKEASDRLDCLQSITGVDFSDVKEQLIRPAMEYACLRYEDKLSYWRHKPKPGRWPKIDGETGDENQNQDVILCGICFKKFSRNAGALLVHAESHGSEYGASGRGLRKCTQCVAFSGNRTDLLKHMRKDHTEEKLFKCS